MKHIELFKDGFDSTVQEKIQPENYPYVGHDIVTSEIVYTLIPNWVTFTAEEDNSSIGLESLSPNQTLEYSTDTTIWNTFDTTTNISLNNGDKVYIRGILSDHISIYNITQFKMTGKIAASGNCNAIWNYQDLNAPLKAYCGLYLFWDCTSLTAAPELPATILNKGCYRWMFYGCTSLITPPKLPATILDNYCYSSMFDGCTSLITPPELPATELTEGCYNSMFWGCSSLTTPPDLPATTLEKECYSLMFGSCTSLVITPELPATTLTERCYYRMFDRCTKLNHITCLATDISASNCTYNWVNRVASTGMFAKHPDMNDWTTGISGIPEGWTLVDVEL